MNRICPRTGRWCELTYCEGCVPTLPHFTAPNTGWVCPRCNVVNAPTVTQCHCHNLPPQGPTCTVGAS